MINHVVIKGNEAFQKQQTNIIELTAVKTE